MFIKSNEFSLYIEKKKLELGLGYIDTILWYMEETENSDFEYLVKNLNRKIIESIRVEATQKKMMKDKEEFIVP